jgi:hypothetical protein
MERALQVLGPVERALPSDRGLNVNQVKRMKKEALYRLFKCLIARDEPLHQKRGGYNAGSNKIQLARSRKGFCIRSG